MPIFTIKLSAKADVFSTVQVQAADEEQAVAKALNPAFVAEQDWSHYPGTYIQGTQAQEEISCEPGDPLDMDETAAEVEGESEEHHG